MAKKQKTNPKVIIPFSENDIQELMDGHEFHWTFPTADGDMDIDIHIRPEIDSDLDLEEDDNI